MAELPDFEKLADETLAAAKDDGIPLRDAIVAHGRICFAEGVRAAKSECAFFVDEELESLAEEAESGQCADAELSAGGTKEAK